MIFVWKAFHRTCSEVFDDHVKLHEILWKLLQHKDVTLNENPHFFDLPLDNAKFDGIFPLQSLHSNKILRDVFPENSPNTHYLYVLKDRQHHITVRCLHPPKSFGNIWKLRQAVILKGEIHSCIHL